MIILDTNVISELMRPDPDMRVLGWLDEQAKGNIGITAISVTEILYGIGSLPDAQIASICRAYNAGFSTRNVRDFEHTGLVVINPWAG